MKTQYEIDLLTENEINIMTKEKEDVMKTGYSPNYQIKAIGRPAILTHVYNGMDKVAIDDFNHVVQQTRLQILDKDGNASEAIGVLAAVHDCEY